MPPIPTVHTSQQPTAIYRGNSTATVKILSGQNEAQPFDARGWCVFMMCVPSNFSGTRLWIDVSYDGVTWFDLYDATGVLVAPFVAPGQAYDLSGAVAGAHYIKLSSDTLQSGDATFVIMLKG